MAVLNLLLYSSKSVECDLTANVIGGQAVFGSDARGVAGRVEYHHRHHHHPQLYNSTGSTRGTSPASGTMFPYEEVRSRYIHCNLIDVPGRR